MPGRFSLEKRGMEGRSWIERVVDGIGPGLFWGVWCFAAGWALAVWLLPVPVDSAAVKLVASILGPAVGAGFAILGALKVMRETGRRESRRAAHHLYASVGKFIRLCEAALEQADTPQCALAILASTQDIFVGQSKMAA